MHGFGHDEGHKVYTWSHDSRDQSWVAQNTRRERVGPLRPRSRVLRSCASEDSDSNLKRRTPSGLGSGLPNLRQAIGAAEHISSQQ